MTIGKQIQKYRKQNNMTQEQMAEETGGYLPGYHHAGASGPAASDYRG